MGSKNEAGYDPGPVAPSAADGASFNLNITTNSEGFNFVQVTSFHRACDHRDDGDEDGGDDVEEGPDEAHLDRPLPLRVLPPQPGEAENGQTDADLPVQDRG